MFNKSSSPNEDPSKRSRPRATWITSILVAVAAAVIAAVSAFASSGNSATASDTMPKASDRSAPASDASRARPHATGSTSHTTTGHSPDTTTGQSPDTTHDPSGSFLLQARGLTVHVYGTATDPDTTRPAHVVYFLGSAAVETAAANRPKHGYSQSWTMPHAGTYRVTVVALNVGKGIPRKVLGSRSVKLIDPATRNPRGYAALSRRGTALQVSGRLTDPDDTRARLVVGAFDNGHVIGWARTDARTRRYGMIVRLHEGVNNVTVKGYNVGVGSPHVILRRAAYRIQPPWTSGYQGNQAIAAKMLGDYGWGPSEMPALVKLWNRESGWSTSARNPDGGAYGIPQALPSSKLAEAGPDWRTSAWTQIRWGLGYIKGRYGSPSAAWAHEVSWNWY